MVTLNGEFKKKEKLRVLAGFAEDPCPRLLTTPDPVVQTPDTLYWPWTVLIYMYVHAYVHTQT